MLGPNYRILLPYKFSGHSLNDFFNKGKNTNIKWNYLNLNLNLELKLMNERNIDTDFIVTKYFVFVTQLNIPLNKIINIVRPRPW